MTTIEVISWDISQFSMVVVVRLIFMRNFVWNAGNDVRLAVS